MQMLSRMTAASLSAYLLLLHTAATAQQAHKGLCRALDDLMALAQCRAHSPTCTSSGHPEQGNRKIKYEA